VQGLTWGGLLCKGVKFFLVHGREVCFTILLKVG
jgi:hypothetical protein